jgi:hypothetical protein
VTRISSYVTPDQRGPLAVSIDPSMESNERTAPIVHAAGLPVAIRDAAAHGENSPIKRRCDREQTCALNRRTPADAPACAARSPRQFSAFERSSLGDLGMKSIVRIVILAAVTAGALAGCSNGSSTAAATAPVVTPPPTQITGIATPRAVSVVTAN